MVHWYDKEVLSTISVGLAAGFAIGWLLRGRKSRWPGSNRRRLSSVSNEADDDLTDDNCPSDTGEYKMVLVVRTDLKMGKGKVAAQCSHAAVGAVQKSYQSSPETLQKWWNCGQPKVVLKTDTEVSLLNLSKKAKSIGLTNSIIRDAGRTQIAPGSQTVLAIGPGPASTVDQVTGHLKLF